MSTLMNAAAVERLTEFFRQAGRILGSQGRSFATHAMGISANLHASPAS